MIFIDSCRFRSIGCITVGQSPKIYRFIMSLVILRLLFGLDEVRDNPDVNESMSHHLCEYSTL